MKKIVLSVMMVLITGAGMAQDQLVATLMHDGNISTFYGYDSFVEAYDASVNGDIITLSSGVFQSSNINKGITIRGAGFVESDNNELNRTTMVGDIHITLADSLDLNIEGVSFYDEMRIEKLYDSQFIKCYFNSLTFYEVGMYYEASDNLFYHCYINYLVHHLRGENSFFSSVLRMGYNGDNYYFHNTFENCILIREQYNDVYDKNSLYRNCIFIGEQDEPLDPSEGCVAHNCINLKSSNFFELQLDDTNRSLSLPISSIFKTYKGQGVPVNETYELTDSAATVFLGGDGTQVGIYGGILPFSSKPSYPRITKFDVSNKTDAEGNLNVKIEIQQGN